MRHRTHRQLVRGALALTLAFAGLAACAPIASAYIYWTNNGTGSGGDGTTIGRANLDGGAINGSVISNAAGPSGIVSDGTHIYWGNNAPGGVYSIGRANLDGSGANPTFVSVGGVFALTTDGTYIYWSDGNRYVGRVGVTGAGANPHFIDMGSGHAPLGIVAYGGTLYIGESARIMSAPASGYSSPSQFTLINGFAATSLASANGYIYWTTNLLGNPSPNGAIGRIQVGGGGIDESYVTGLTYPTGVATDGNELYWIDHTPGTLGRAVIGSPGATNIQPAFISDAGGPWGVTVDSAIDATRTTVSCNPGSLAVGNVSACTAIVSDSASTAVPSGNVLFGGGSSVYFSGGNSCTLTPRPAGGASCTVAAAASAVGLQTLTASYTGDSVHAPSSGSGGFCAGTASECAGSGPGGGGGTQPVCTVPKLKGKTLAAARRLLAAAHCRLGKIARPRSHKHHPVAPLVIASQQPKPGTVLPNGAQIGVRAVARAARARHR